MKDGIAHNSQRQDHSTKTRSVKRGRVLHGAYYLVTVALIAVSVFLFLQYQDLKNNPEKAISKEVSSVTEKVAKLMTLPKEEAPVLATIEDVSKLKGQPFFSDANNGDRILMYTQAKKAIIYREDQDKIINVGPMALSTDNE